MKQLFREIKAAMGIYDAPEAGRVHGVLGEFAHPGALVEAAKGAREAGLRFYDAHSPFPIHGMDRAMGLGNSKVGLFTLGGAVTGLSLGTWLQWWTSAVDYPINISNKPTFAFEPSIPIMFELTVLLAGLGTAVGMFAINGLPRPYNPLFESKRFGRVTDDAFFLFVSASDPRYEHATVTAMMERLGALHIETLTEPSGEDDADGETFVAPDEAPAVAAVTA